MESLPQRPQPSRPLAETLLAWLQWFGLVRLIVTAVAVLSVGAGAYWLLRAPASPVEQTLPTASRAPVATTSAGSTSPVGSDPAAAAATTVAGALTVSVPEGPQEIVVHVAGAVVRPGVLHLRLDARVEAALAAAGGPSGDADLDALNLAEPLHDGDRLYVPHLGQAVPTVVSPSGGAPGPTGSSDSSSTAPLGPVDLNRATAEQLDSLPGVGPATAAAIVAYRDQHGPFATVDDLLRVRGIGPAKLDAIRTLVTV